MERRALLWAWCDDLVPLYPLYALLFVHAGLGAGAISALFAIWSLASVVAEVPCGALADRLPRRAVIAAGEVLRAAGYALWTIRPGFASFAGGFVLWGIGGACTSGALEALLYDELAAVGAGTRLAGLLGRVRATSLLSQVPLAALAGALFALGGYPAAGWASVALTLLAAWCAVRLPETDRPAGAAVAVREYPATLWATLWATLRSGLRVACGPQARDAVIVTAAVAGLDVVEEYVPLLAASWGVPTAAVPAAVAVVPLVGALGAASAGRRVFPGGRSWALLTLAAAVWCASAVWGRPGALLAVAIGYGLYRLVLVRVEVRLQERLDGPVRATATSVAALLGEVPALLGYLAWSVGGLVAMAVLTGTVAAVGRLLDRPLERD